MIGIRADKIFTGHYHRCEAGLHVGSTTTHKISTRLGGNEGIRLPLLSISGGYHVCVPGKYQQRARCAARCPEIIDLTEAHGFDRETCLLQTRHHQRLAARVFGGHRGAGDQVAGQSERVLLIISCWHAASRSARSRFCWSGTARHRYSNAA